MALIISTIFLSVSLAVQPQSGTKLILCFICLHEIVWNINFLLHTLAQFFQLFVNLAFRHLIGVHFLTILDTMNHLLYLGYAVHRYAIITNSPGISQYFKSIGGIICFWLLSFVFACATSVSRTIYMISGYQLPSLTFFFETVKLLGQISALTIHAWASVSLSKTLSQSEKFLKSLIATKVIEKRLAALIRIKRFSVVFFLVHIFISFISNIRDVFDALLQAKPFHNNSLVYFNSIHFCDSLSNAGRMIASMMFAFIHFVYMRNYWLCRCSEV